MTYVSEIWLFLSDTESVTVLLFCPVKQLDYNDWTYTMDFGSV